MQNIAVEQLHNPHHHRAAIEETSQCGLTLGQRVFGSLPFGNIHVRAGHPAGPSVGISLQQSTGLNPTVAAVFVTQAVFEFVCADAPGQIVVHKRTCTSFVIGMQSGLPLRR